MHPEKEIEKVIDKPYYLTGVRIGCAGVSDCLSEFRELSLSYKLGLVQMYALAYAYAYILGRRRTSNVFLPISPFAANYAYELRSQAFAHLDL